MNGELELSWEQTLALANALVSKHAEKHLIPIAYKAALNRASKMKS
jgi:hypothetical protein